ncbi:hypothetical protein [Bacillus sp. FJAT-27245]|uniref:hypothetical protein n=1 Tax=Bacillus sp. FJAT-27245 TaxID=1684144 RepID=UPI0006A79311|nr:hypothetical protein [Bacillus sp. FJAT-27245]
MAYSSFIRFTGLCGIIAGVLTISLSVWYNISMEAFGSYVDLIGMLFLLLALIGIYLVNAIGFGKTGFGIFLLTFFGAAMWTGHSWVNAFVVPVLEENAPAVLEEVPPLLMTGVSLSLYPFFIGLLLFGVLLALKGVLPKWAGIILALVPILDFVPYGSYVAQPLAGVAILWLGWVIWKEQYNKPAKLGVK